MKTNRTKMNQATNYIYMYHTHVHVSISYILKQLSQYSCLHFMVMIFCFSKSQREIRFLAQLLPQQENKKEGALTYANQHGTASVWAAN